MDRVESLVAPPPNFKHDVDVSDWISTKEAMKLLGVGPTTIKRWADDGRLPYYRTAGGHRRFRESAVRRLAIGAERRERTRTMPEAARWVRILIERDLAEVAAEVRNLFGEYGDWFEVADFLGLVAQTIGQNWADDECSIVEQHHATVKLSQAITAIGTVQSVGPNAPICLVATLGLEPHGLGALLVQLCLRCQGLNGTSLGTMIPADELCTHLQTSSAELVALSASSWQTDAATLARNAERVAAVCEKRDITLVLGGDGAWPDGPASGYRCHSFVEVRSVLKEVGLTK